MASSEIAVLEKRLAELKAKEAGRSVFGQAHPGPSNAPEVREEKRRKKEAARKALNQSAKDESSAKSRWALQVGALHSQLCKM